MSDWLDRLVGDWTYDADSVPSNPERQSSGGETVVRRGLWIVIESDDQARFQLALDQTTGRVTGDFVNWNHASLWTYDGVPDGDRLVLRSRGPHFDGTDGVTDYEDIWEIPGPDERTTTGRVLGEDGRWSDFNVTRYRRKGA